MGLAAVVFMGDMFLSLDREKSGIKCVLYYNAARKECREKNEKRKKSTENTQKIEHAIFTKEGRVLYNELCIFSRCGFWWKERKT